MTNIKNDIDLLNKGMLPDSLQFGLRNKDNYNWSKLQYNNLYRTYEYHSNKFSLGGLEPIIQLMANNTTSPLEEMLNRHNDSFNIRNNIKLFNELTYFLDNNI